MPKGKDKRSYGLGKGGDPSYALSNEDIQKILKTPTRIFTYPELNDITHIDSIFDDMGRCIMLYPTESQYSGHWVAMLKKGNTIEYFDPYGLPPEGPKRWLTDSENAALGQGRNRLTQLMRDSGCKVIYNTVPYQKEDSDISTCGRWSVARLVCKDMDYKKFNQLVKHSDVNPDEFATTLTFRLLGK